MKQLFLLSVLFILVLGTVACSPTVTNNPTASTSETLPDAEDATTAPEPEQPTAEASPTDASQTTTCPSATADTYLLRAPQLGFCLLYPVTHKVDRPNEQEVLIVLGGMLNTTDPRAAITVTPSDGRTAIEAADEIVAGFEGFEITRSETTVAGEPAVVLDDVPGQDINQRVLFTHEGLLYQLTFSPIDPENLQPIDTFRQAILTSFTFIPVSETITAADECVEPKADQQLISSEEFGYCFIAPADFTYEQPSTTNANLFYGSMMDVEHPKLMIEVIDAAGMTTAEAADELAASFEGFEIPRTFGYTLGYENAEHLDGVPGQDLGRVLLVVHDGKLYRLTFVPADPTQTEVYAQMEILFGQVLNTFRFLP